MIHIHFCVLWSMQISLWVLDVKCGWTPERADSLQSLWWAVTRVLSKLWFGEGTTVKANLQTFIGPFCLKLVNRKAASCLQDCDTDRSVFFYLSSKAMCNPVLSTRAMLATTRFLLFYFRALLCLFKKKKKVSTMSLSFKIILFAFTVQDWEQSSVWVQPYVSVLFQHAVPLLAISPHCTHPFGSSNPL